MENYEQKYKEALVVMSNLHKNNKDSTLAKTIEKAFPELAESEDEKMREMAIKAVYAPEAQSCIKSWGINPDDVIAWLEKQCVRKPIISNNALREGIAHFGITQYQIDNWLKKYVDVEKQGEQKSVEWNEDDKWNIQVFCNALDLYREPVDKTILKSWLKSIRPQSHWKPTDYQISLLEELARNIRNNIRPFCSEVTSLEGLIEQLKTL